MGGYTSDHAYASLTNTHALSEVRVVHDYIQFIFGPYTLSLYAPLSVVAGGRPLTRNDAGYYDCICSLLGQSLVAVAREGRVQLEFAFSDGTKLLVSLRQEDAVGPEVAQLSRLGGDIMVEGYDD